MKILFNIIDVFILLVLFALLIHFLEWLLKPSINPNQVKTSYQKNYPLYVLRVRNGLSEKEAAKYLGTSYPGYCYYESGKLDPVPAIWLEKLKFRLEASGKMNDGLETFLNKYH